MNLLTRVRVQLEPNAHIETQNSHSILLKNKGPFRNTKITFHFIEEQRPI